MAHQTVFRPSIPTLEEIIHKSGFKNHRYLLENECSDAYLLMLSDEIDNWRNYAEVLGLKTHEINGIASNLNLDSRFKCKTMLDSWHNHCGYKATYLQLMKAFHKMENSKLAQTVCHLLSGMYCP